MFSLLSLNLGQYESFKFLSVFSQSFSFIPKAIGNAMPQLVTNASESMLRLERQIMHFFFRLSGKFRVETSRVTAVAIEITLSS